MKCQKPYFDEVATGRKRVEIRKDDRGGFAVGDVLDLQEYDPQRPVASFIPQGLTAEQVTKSIVNGSIRIGYTGRACRVAVTHILRGAPWVPDGYVAMSVRLENAQPDAGDVRSASTAIVELAIRFKDGDLTADERNREAEAIVRGFVAALQPDAGKAGDDFRTRPIHGCCLICFEDKPFDAFRTNCGTPPNDVVGVCKDCTAAAITARNARRAQPGADTNENGDSDEGYDDSADTGIIHCPRCQHPNDANETACILCSHPLPGGACNRD